MLYTDPRKLDFGNPISDHVTPHLTADRGGRQTFDHPTWEAVRLAAGYEPHLLIIPNGANYLVGAGLTYEARAYAPPGSFLVAISASSSNAAGFRLQFTDLGTGGQLSNQPTKHKNLTGGSAGIVQPLWFPDKPRPIPAPGLISVQVSNMATAPAEIQVVLWLIAPADGQHTPNEYNAVLQSELAWANRAIRSGSGFNAGAGSGSGPAPSPAKDAMPHLFMPANAQPLFYQQAVDVPVPGTSKYRVLSFRVPPGFKASVQRIRNIYTGPGFTEGSGKLLWHISVDGVFAPGFDSIITTLGDGQFQDLPAPLTAGPGQLVEYLVSVDAGAAGLGEKTICGFQGYLYPEQ